MKLFSCVDHDEHYSVGVASVVVAEDEAQARVLLDEALTAAGLNPNEPYTLNEIPLDQPSAHVLHDGNY